MSVEECLDKCFYYLGKVLDSKSIAAHLLDPLENTAIRLTKLSKDCEWTQADWIENLKSIRMDQSFETLMQKVIKTKSVITGPMKKVSIYL